MLIGRSSYSYLLQSGFYFLDDVVQGFIQLLTNHLLTFPKPEHKIHLHPSNLRCQL